MSFETPIAFIIFKRPDLTQQVFDAIRQIQPKKLLVIADGPRSSEEEEKCRATRAIIDSVDWDCEVLKNYSHTNLGGPIRVSSGIDWVFSQVNEAIILEDDCLPHQSFFSFCSQLLSYYREDTRVWVVSGDNFQDGHIRGDGSYYFSRYPHCWGWATWSRAWKYYDKELSTWPTSKKLSLLDSVLDDPLEVEVWSNRFDRLFHSPQPCNWDFTWTYTCWKYSGLTVLPNYNLVSNIGVGPDASNTKTGGKLFYRPIHNLESIVHPSLIVRNKYADAYTFEYFMGGAEQRRARKDKNNWISRKIYRGRAALSRIKRSLFC